MNWREYFEETTGEGYLATADSSGQVNAAPFVRPEVLEDGTLAFGMRDGKTLRNLRDNAHATYLFNEGGYKGVRIYLERREEAAQGVLLERIRRRADTDILPGMGEKLSHVVTFRVVSHRGLTDV